MKRIHLFEFEDLSWFPAWLRNCLTRLIIVVHKMLQTDCEFAALIAKVLERCNCREIVDLCSGSGGPMFNVFRLLKDTYKLENIKMTLTDLYPDNAAIERIQAQADNIRYIPQPVDATHMEIQIPGLRTMIGGFHHFKPDKARKILESAHGSRQPICIFEISDNSFPTFLWWLVLPVNIIMCLLITPMVRPMTWQQLIFTYLIPVIPLCFAWDGAVSNARTYTLKDMEHLLTGLDSEDYIWEKGLIKRRSRNLFLIGTPK